MRLLILAAAILATMATGKVSMVTYNTGHNTTEVNTTHLKAPIYLKGLQAFRPLDDSWMFKGSDGFIYFCWESSEECKPVLEKE